jgi:hypothetical protein
MVLKVKGHPVFPVVVVVALIEPMMTNDNKMIYERMNQEEHSIAVIKH